MILVEQCRLCVVLTSLPEEITASLGSGFMAPALLGEALLSEGISGEGGEEFQTLRCF